MTKTLTRDQLMALLKKKQGDRTISEFAKELGITQGYLSDIYRGNRNVGESVLSKLNLVKEVVYREAS